MAAPVPIVEPDFRRERYGPGQSVDTFPTAIAAVAPKPSVRAGDFILTHSSGIFGRLIRLGEYIRYRGAEKAFAHWSHAAIFVNDSGILLKRSAAFKSET